MRPLQRFATASLILIGILGFEANANAAAPYIVHGPAPVVVNDAAVNAYEHKLHREIAWDNSERSHAYQVASLTPPSDPLPNEPIDAVEGSDFSLVGLSILPQAEQTIHGDA